MNVLHRIRAVIRCILASELPSPCYIAVTPFNFETMQNLRLNLLTKNLLLEMYGSTIIPTSSLLLWAYFENPDGEAIRLILILQFRKVDNPQRTYVYFTSLEPHFD